MEEKQRILDIAMNLHRIGNWTANDYEGKRKRILLFLEQTSAYLKTLNPETYPRALKQSIERFLKLYPQLEKDLQTSPHDSLKAAEQYLTWGNILTHRAQLLS